MKKLLIGLLLPHTLHTYADANIYGRFGGGVESLQIRQGRHKAGIRDFDSYVGMEVAVGQPRERISAFIKAFKTTAIIQTNLQKPATTGNTSFLAIKSGQMTNHDGCLNRDAEAFGHFAPFYLAQY